MCRIFYALNQSKLKHKIIEFLKQSDRPDRPDRPYMTSTRHPELPATDEYTNRKHLDGYGLAFFNGETWTVCKSEKTYKTEPNTKQYVELAAKMPLVIGHIRRKTEIAPISLVNTHPFVYGDNVFLHNGNVFGFNERKHLLVKHILPHYITEIKGETDTEHIFYLLLSYIERLWNHDSKSPDPEIVSEAFLQVFSRLSKIYSKWNANIIYANHTHSYIVRTKYLNKRQHPKEKFEAQSLYWNGSLENETKLLITSEPIMKTYSVIPENSFIVVPHYERINT